MNELVIVGISDTVTLLSTVEGVRLVEWTPKLQKFKGGGGVYQDSPLANLRRRVFAKRETAFDEFVIDLIGPCPANVVLEWQRFLAILEEANGYWEDDYATTPVYLKFRFSGAGGYLYGTLHGYEILELKNPFAQPFFGLNNSELDELTCTVERGYWQDQIPGTAAVLPLLIEGVEEYKTTWAAMVANHGETGQLDYIFVDDGGAFGSNLVNSDTFDLLPAAPVADDAVYFGNDGVYYFFNLVFNLSAGFLGTAAVGVWEFWNGSAWAAFSTSTTLVDGTNQLHSTGINTVSWNSLISQTTVNGVDGKWVRFRVTTATGITSIPAQQSEVVYSPTRPYLQINGSDLPGDTDSLARFLLKIERGGNPTGDYQIGAIAGARQLSRGTNFNAYLHLTNGGPTPGGITLAAGTGSGFSGGYSSPAGSLLTVNGDTSTDFDSTTVRCSIHFDTSIAAEYKGRYRAFVRAVTGTAGGGARTIRLITAPGTDGAVIFSRSETWVGTISSTDVQLIDLGTFDVLSGVNTGDVFEFYILLQVYNGIAAGEIFFHDLILIPIDEVSWRIDSAQELGTGHYFDVQSHSPRYENQVITRRSSDDAVIDIPQLSTNNLISLKNDVSQRLWMLQFWVSGTDQYSVFADQFKVQAYRVGRYLGFR